MIKNIKQLNITELLLTIIITSGFLSDFLQKVLNVSKNANMYILLVEIILIFIKIFQNRKKYLKLKVNILCLYIFTSLVTLFFLSGMKYGSQYYSFSQFAFYFIVPFLFASSEVKTNKVLKNIMLISVIIIPFWNKIFVFQYELLSQIAMGSAYSLIIFVIAAILHFSFFYDYKNAINKLLYLYELIIMIKLITVSNRGVILELILCIILVLTSKYNRGEGKKNSSFGHIIKVLLFGLTSIIVIYNIESILSGLYNFFESNFNLTISFLKKSSELISKNNLSNGRENLYITALNLIVKRPIIGYGIRGFALYGGEGWIHNLFFQLIFDGGIVFGLLPIILLISNAYRVIISKEENKNRYVMNLFLLLMVFPRHFVSNDIWLTPFVWLLLSYSIKTKKKRKEDLIYEK